MEYENDIITTDTDEEVVKPQKSNGQLKREYQQFTDYSTSKSKKDYEEYEIIQTYTPKKKPNKNANFKDFVDEQNSYSPSKETFVYEKVKQTPKMQKSNKIFICICCVICVCMGVLGIVNAVNINNLNYSNLSKTQEIANLGQEITKIDQVIEGMIDKDTVKENGEQNGMESVTNKTKIELIEKKQVEDYQGQTNFFDRICNFFSHLFGG